MSPDTVPTVSGVSVAADTVGTVSVSGVSVSGDTTRQAVAVSPVAAPWRSQFLGGGL